MSAVDQYLAARNLQIASPDGGRPYFRTLTPFNQTYWGGLDAAIYFNDLYIGEVVALHYEEQEATYPLMGYADYIKTGSLHGQRRVMGQFTINFQQALMMYLIMEHLRSGGQASPLAKKAMPPVNLTPQSAPQTPRAAAQTAASMLLPQAVTSLSELYVEKAGAKVFDPGSQKMATVIRKVKSSTLSAVATNAQRLKEQYHWADPQSKPVSGPGATLLAAVKNSLVSQGYQSKYDVQGGFTIGIVLGEMDYTGALQTSRYEGAYQAPSSVLVPTDFDDAYFRAAAQVDKSDVNAALRELPPATMLQITDVDITGHGMTIDDTGRPLLQTYAFLAADITTQTG